MFMFGCLILVSFFLAWQRIERLEKIIKEQQTVIQTQQQANSALQFENYLLKTMR